MFLPDFSYDLRVLRLYRNYASLHGAMRFLPRSHDKSMVSVKIKEQLCIGTAVINTHDCLEERGGVHPTALQPQAHSQVLQDQVPGVRG